MTSSEAAGEDDRLGDQPVQAGVRREGHAVHGAVQDPVGPTMASRARRRSDSEGIEAPVGEDLQGYFGGKAHV